MFWHILLVWSRDTNGIYRVFPERKKKKGEKNTYIWGPSCTAILGGVPCEKAALAVEDATGGRTGAQSQLHVTAAMSSEHSSGALMIAYLYA